MMMSLANLNRHSRGFIHDNNGCVLNIGTYKNIRLKEKNMNMTTVLSLSSQISIFQNLVQLKAAKKAHFFFIAKTLGSLRRDLSNSYGKKYPIS